MASASEKPLVVIIGSLNIDFVTTTPRCPLAGETLNATSLNIFPGGKGSNQAVGCGRATFTSPGSQDVDVQMVGAVGANDINVQNLLFPTLEQSGVGITAVKQMETAQTGTATIIVETEAGKGENRILFVAGANHKGMSDVDSVLELVHRVSRGRDPDIVVMQGEIPRDSTLGLLKYFNHSQKGTRVVFNPAPVFEEGIPLEALNGLEVLVVNETETLLLGNALRGSGFDMAGAEAEKDLETESTLRKLTQQFHELAKVKTVLITLGARGVWYSTVNGDKQGLVSAVKVEKVVDTTAAGDTFVGYFVAGLARHATSGKGDEDYDIVAALRNANAAAAKCVQRAGAMQSIPFGYE